jgi:signal transduction histidine kinase
MTSHYDISKNKLANGVEVRNKKGEYYFSIFETQKENAQKNNRLSLFFFLIGILCLLSFVHHLATQFAEKRSLMMALIFLSVSIFVMRSLLLLHLTPVDLRQFDLFNPTHFKSGLWIPSLGDLLLHGLGFLWLIIFYRNRIGTKRWTVENKKALPFVYLSLISVVLIASAYVTGNLIRDLVTNADFSLDAIRFFTLSTNSAIGFLVISILILCFFLLSQILFFLYHALFNGKVIPLLISLCVFSMAYLSFKIGEIKGGFEIYITIWLLFFSLISVRSAHQLTKNPVSTRQVFWFAFLSVSVSVILLHETHNRELLNRKKFANTIKIRLNPVNESMVNSTIIDLRGPFLKDQFYRFFDTTSSIALKDSLIKSASSSYSNNYDSEILTFTSEEKPLFNLDSVTYNEILAILGTQAKPTVYKDLFYFNQTFNQFSFIFKKEVSDTGGNILGYLFFIANPKTEKRDALYPELFSKGNEQSIENAVDYAVAMYRDGKLVNSFNDYPFPVSLSSTDFPNSDQVEIKKEGVSEWWDHAGPGKWVVIARDTNITLELITLFSYIFCVLLLIGALIWIIMHLFSIRLNKNDLKKIWYLSIRNQIQGTILLISAISFVIIGFASIWFFVNRFESTNREKLSRVIRILDKEIRKNMGDREGFSTAELDSSANILSKLQSSLSKISEIHGVDVNIYDISGKLTFSSLSLPYNKGILSSTMNPIAFHHLSRLNESQFFQEEKIGKLRYISHYIPVLNDDGVSIAFLNIPYFTSETALRQEISNFLITIINLNAFIFLLAGIISLFITNRIAQSFSLIAQKMQQVNLDMHNEPIVWDRNDEIGALVKQYNKMVSKLEEGAAKLAKTEREGAWREMAKQVAHEIKNPLTPMKLSMQFLQKAIDQKAPNVEELASNVSKTLIQQMDHLSNIANAFSQFAHIGEPQKESFLLHEVIQNVVDLHQMNNEVQMHCHLLKEHDFIYADKTQINRLFTNLIINALQSIPEDKTPEIRIRQYIVNKDVVTAIVDNGTGIPDEVRANIFTPNFTTKSSGTGLGLAMCKRIVEQSQGEIWYESEYGFGTTFFIRLPLHKEA